jgi:four helix bundle protein
MGTPIRGYRDLQVWQVSMRLVEETFKLTHSLLEAQRFGLISQMQRAAVSIPSNIAEGHAKRSGKDYRRHLQIAAGSTAELETQIELCVRLQMAERDQIREIWVTSQRVAQMLSRLIQKLSRSSSRTPNAGNPLN